MARVLRLLPPRTFDEAIAIRTGRAATTEKILYAAVTLTLVGAGCSLAVAVGGGLVDRKRPFTLLRVTGIPVSTLSRVVIMEAALPLAAATAVAAALAYGTSIVAVVRIAPPGTPVPQLGHVYYATMGTGLAIALLPILVTLPLLRRMTSPDSCLWPAWQPCSDSPVMRSVGSQQILSPHDTGGYLRFPQARANYRALGEASSAATFRCVRASVAYGTRRRVDDEKSNYAHPATCSAVMNYREATTVVMPAFGYLAAGRLESDVGHVRVVHESASGQPCGRAPHSRGSGG